MIVLRLTSAFFSIARSVGYALLTFVAVSFSGVAHADSGLKPWLLQTISAEDSRHILSRTGFGVSLSQLEKLEGLNRAEAVESIIAEVSQKPSIPMPNWVNEPAPRFWTRSRMSSTDRQHFDRTRDREMVELRQWWVNNMLQSNSPQTERLVLFWHDHFATGYAGLNRQSILMARQNQTFRRHALGSFRELLKAMIRDPALLQYLNSASNKKGSPNENLAREFLELFTLGEGNYNELTVKEAARALTGYGYSSTYNLTFQLNTNHHDTDNKTLFGVTANHNGDSLVDVLLEQDAAASHLAKKFWHSFVSDAQVDAKWLDQIAKTFRDSNYDLETLYRSVLQSKAFWQKENRLALIKSPASLLIGTARSLDYPKKRWQQLPSLQALLGMDLFEPPNVSGWTEGGAFVIPGRLLSRQQALSSLVSLIDAGELPYSSVNTSLLQQNADSQSMNNMMTENMMSENMMSENGMSEPPMAKDQTVNVKLRLAAEHFEGPAQYRVSFYHQNKRLWQGANTTLHVGLDTEIFGRSNDRSMLPWQLVDIDVPKSVIDAATTVEVSFLNDHASERGDRNLYIDGMSIQDHWFSAAGGEQSSNCAPKGRMDAGNLYCQGDVRFPITRTTSNASRIALNKPFSFDGVQVLWSQTKAERIVVEVALENVQLPHRNFHTLSMSLISLKANHLDLRINSFDCWPDCFEVWPDCAWQDDLDAKLRTISVSLLSQKQLPQQCHYAQLSPVDKQMLNTLISSIPTLMDAAVKNVFRNRDIKTFSAWKTFYNQHKRVLSRNQVTRNARMLRLVEKPSAVQVAVSSIKAPTINFDNLTSLAAELNEHQLGLADVLMAGADANAFPDLKQLSRLSVEHQLKTIIEHPVYQVH